MKIYGVRILLAGLGLLLSRSLCDASETNTVLVCNNTRIKRYTVENGTWTLQSDFATVNNIDVIGGIASNGRRVFVSEDLYNAPSRILEYDRDGNYRRVLVTAPNSVEHLNMSQDGKWLYASVGIWLADAAAIYRYDSVTGAGGLFIPNEGTNALGEVLWKFNVPRGLVEDDDGALWISERTTGSVYKFDSAGTYLGKVTSLPNIQTLHYSSEDQKIYGVANDDATYTLNTATGVAVINTIAGLGARRGVTQIGGVLYSSPSEFIISYDLGLLTFSNVIASVSGVKQIITLPSEPPLRGTLILVR